MKELIVIRGLPGSGKSTYAKKTYPTYHIFEPDHLIHDLNGNYCFDSHLWPHAHALIEKLVDHSLSRENNTIVVDVFPRHSDYKVYQELAAYHGVKFKVKVIKTSFGSIHHVPKFVMNQMAELWED